MSAFYAPGLRETAAEWAVPHRTSILRRCTLALFLGPALAASAPAQETTATLVGTVSDLTGALLPGVTVAARNTTTGVSKTVVTTDTGRYVLPFLPLGSYEVTFSLSGFRPYVAHGIEVHVNDRLTINATLGVSGGETTVEVTAAARMVQATPSVQTLMGPLQVQELPLNNRNFVQLATLVPGVSSSLPDEVGIGLTNVVSVSIAGARRNAVNWFVDGASDVDVGSNITLLSVPTLESIEEFKIITSSYAAEWPRSGGGIVNVVTKGGTNSFRASAYEYYRNDALNANGFFRKQSASPEIADHPAQLDYHNFGYTIGGPIKKDRLFFFWSQEWRTIDRAPTDLVATVPPAGWLDDPSNPNYVAPSLRDPNAVALLAAYPAPNTGENQYRSTAANAQDTRQEVLRLDWSIGARWRLMARYTHDLSQTTEPGGLFFGTAIPDIATTRTRVPGQVFVGQLTTTLSDHVLNELSLQLSGNAIKSEYGQNARNRRDAFGIDIPELFPENRNDLVPTVAISGLTSIGANQLFDNSYWNSTLADNLSYQTGNHTLKGGLLVALERKNELSTSATQGSFSFGAGGGRTAFQNFLTGNADGLCGASCTYTEPESELASRLRFNRYEAFFQDSWKARPGLSIDFGVRYAVYPGVVDVNDVLTNFVPSRFDPAAAPAWSTAAASTLVAGSGDFSDGIVVAGETSPYGRRIQATQWDRIQPRLGFAWDVGNDSRMVVRGGFGVYYDQPLVGIFLQNAFTNPPFVTSPSVQNPQLSFPGAGTSPSAVPPVALSATSDPFALPRTLQWNLGVQRRLFARAAVDVSYIGSRGDSLIQPVDVNAALPADVVAANGVVNLARPYQGYAGITMRQTTGYTRYRALAVGLRYDAGRAGTLQVAYTLSRARTTATNDRDTIDLPQDRTNLDAEYALARTDRTHVFTASWVYELPFFKASTNPLVEATLRGWQLSGIATFWSGPPISQVVNGNTNGGRSGIRVDQVGDPFADLPPNGPGYVYWFNPAAFAPPADGQLGTTGRAIFRLPGVNQWDLTLSKSWFLSKDVRLQLRADFINAFNHTQLDPTAIQNVCPSSPSATCVVAGSSFGQITGARSPREIQLGLRLNWR
jgi:Carboxypeptidase regulatory-like domain